MQIRRGVQAQAAHPPGAGARRFEALGHHQGKAGKVFARPAGKAGLVQAPQQVGQRVRVPKRRRRGGEQGHHQRLRPLEGAVGRRLVGGRPQPLGRQRGQRVGPMGQRPQRARGQRVARQRPQIVLGRRVELRQLRARGRGVVAAFGGQLRQATVPTVALGALGQLGGKRRKGVERGGRLPLGQGALAVVHQALAVGRGLGVGHRHRGGQGRQSLGGGAAPLQPVGVGRVDLRLGFALACRRPAGVDVGHLDAVLATLAVLGPLGSGQRRKVQPPRGLFGRGTRLQPAAPGHRPRRLAGLAQAGAQGRKPAVVAGRTHGQVVLEVGLQGVAGIKRGKRGPQLGKVGGQIGAADKGAEQRPGLRRVAQLGRLDEVGERGVRIAGRLGQGHVQLGQLRVLAQSRVNRHQGLARGQVLRGVGQVLPQQGLGVGRVAKAGKGDLGGRKAQRQARVLVGAAGNLAGQQRPQRRPVARLGQLRAQGRGFFGDGDAARLRGRELAQAPHARRAQLGGQRQGPHHRRLRHRLGQRGLGRQRHKRVVQRLLPQLPANKQRRQKGVGLGRLGIGGQQAAAARLGRRRRVAVQLGPHQAGLQRQLLVCRSAALLERGQLAQQPLGARGRIALRQAHLLEAHAGLFGQPAPARHRADQGFDLPFVGPAGRIGVGGFEVGGPRRQGPAGVRPAHQPVGGFAAGLGPHQRVDQAPGTGGVHAAHARRRPQRGQLAGFVAGVAAHVGQLVLQGARLGRPDGRGVGARRGGPLQPVGRGGGPRAGGPRQQLGP